MLIERFDDLSEVDFVNLMESGVFGFRIGADEEVHGEILFVLYKLSIVQGDEVDDFLCFCPKLLYLSLEALIKTQNDDPPSLPHLVNDGVYSTALLTVLAQRGCFQFENSSANAENFIQSTQLAGGASLIGSFAEAIKGPLLSSDMQVQIGALDLIFHTSSSDITCKHIQRLIEENVADYVFEVLRLSGNKDRLVVSCLQVLGLFATAEETIRQSLAIGFPTLIPVLRYVAEIPFHPVQPQTLKLISSCITQCPGIISISQVEELVMILTVMLRTYGRGEMGLLPETFTMACSAFVALLTLPASSGISSLAASIPEVASNVILSSFCEPYRNPNQVLLYSLYLLKEAYAYIQEQNSEAMDNIEVVNSILRTCEKHLLPWVERSVDEANADEEVILGVLEAFHSILLLSSDANAGVFAQTLASSSWFGLSFGCLGLFPSDQMKWRVYLLLSSIIDRILGNDAGQPIRDAAAMLPTDPLDLLFLLEQKSFLGSDLISCQAAVLLILYASSLQQERLADDMQVLASLEQYILVNNSNVEDCTELTQLAHLYGLIRGSESSETIPYSFEAEKLLLHLLVDKEWDMLSVKIHPTALKWLFRQDKILIPLSTQILNFCRFNSKEKTQVINLGENTSQTIDIKLIAQLMASGDNFGPQVLVSLLKQLQEDGQEDNIITVLNLMSEILNIFPAASNQFCMHGFSNVIQHLYYSTSPSTSICTTCLLLVFNILRSASPEMLSDQEAWLLITTKLLEHLISTFAADKCNRERHLVMSILSLILHHSTSQALTEAAKAIMLNTSFASAVKNIIQTTCAKGPALADNDEETSTGETLIFTLLLLIYFGPTSVKLIASHCLLKLLTRITDQRNRRQDELKCSVKYLQSVMAVLEGSVFYGDTGVAMNCALCLSLILGWEKLGAQEKKAIKEDKWCRVLIEELALSLAAPSLGSKSFTNQCKPATHIAVALLRVDQAQEWMRSVFDGPCISGIIGNLSAGNMSVDIAWLFRELVAFNYLNEEQVEGLSRVFLNQLVSVRELELPSLAFILREHVPVCNVQLDSKDITGTFKLENIDVQACRKHLYMNNSEELEGEDYSEKVVAFPDHLGNAYKILLRIISAPTAAPRGLRAQQKKLLEEIEMFMGREYSARRT
ncbi:hypothetical protein ACLOJK_008139 [Asimina triloba]